MSVAVLSLLGLSVVIIVSCVLPKVNPGLLAILVALSLGTGLASLPVKAVIGNFPSDLFLLLVSICLVFGVANSNRTLPALTNRIVGLIKGRAVLLPLLFFLLSFALSALGPGNIAAVALLAVLAMTLAHQYKISPLLTAIMIATGANAGAFSPFSPTGVVAVRLMDQIGLETAQLQWVVFGGAAVMQSITALAAYGIFLIRRQRRMNGKIVKSNKVELFSPEEIAFGKTQWLTLVGILALLVGVIFFNVPLITMSLSVLLLFAFFGLGNPEEVLTHLPWSTILMVTGISVLIGLMEKVGGLDLATTLIAQTTAPHFINAVLAFITGIVSAFSSSSGVVMPAFIPLVPGLAEKMGLTNQVDMVVAIAVGSHMVDVSPLSTLGALALAAMPDQSQRGRVFKWLLIWGMAMAFVGAGMAYVLLDLKLW